MDNAIREGKKKWRLFNWYDEFLEQKEEYLFKNKEMIDVLNPSYAIEKRDNTVEFPNPNLKVRVCL